MNLKEMIMPELEKALDRLLEREAPPEDFCNIESVGVYQGCLLSIELMNDPEWVKEFWEIQEEGVKDARKCNKAIIDG